MRPSEIEAMQTYLLNAKDIPPPTREAMWRLIDEVKRLASLLATATGQPNHYR